LIERIEGFKRSVASWLNQVCRNRSKLLSKLLNDARAEFWQAPAGYVIWEKSEANKLGKLLRGN
jgi:hypothetical protein